jgi:ER lumen protein retaining receptor
MTFVQSTQHSEVLYTFSIHLEAVAIVPQLFVVHRMAQGQRGFVENLTSHYVFTLGGYRVFYLLNWVYRLATQVGYRNWIVWLSGLVQTGLYIDFFYYYAKAQYEGKSMSLPM